ncbi:enoyl-CoA hydratase/isomerase [Polychaeton citri CBS 116435]|uniref:Enoyl-CoA hydratase/isomerase n=1 Tax=Polychaeton citri CBS 116435 TaxID=1314669 RepID=A0A9P4Q4N3_9PEZI|nr:enoyl-CoA hydratase/isomerase [Polychaeton citri CBS 116435]
MATTSPEQAVSVAYNGRVAIITLNIEKKLNAMTQDLYFRLSQLLREVATKPEVYITILTGKGRFFSAGADVTITRSLPEGVDRYHSTLQNFVANNLNTTQAFYSHPKILVTALNGPAVGLSAALIGFSDFIYAAPHTFLLTPFSSLGLVAEGGASRGFVQRLGLAKANEALIMSKRITCEELVQTGFVNKVFDVKPGDTEELMKKVLEEVEERLGSHLNQDSLLEIKALIRRPERQLLDAQGVAEVFGGLERFNAGVPQREFEKLARGEKRHKL